MEDFKCNASRNGSLVNLLSKDFLFLGCLPMFSSMGEVRVPSRSVVTGTANFCHTKNILHPVNST